MFLKDFVDETNFEADRPDTICPSPTNCMRFNEMVSEDDDNNIDVPSEESIDALANGFAVTLRTVPPTVRSSTITAKTTFVARTVPSTVRSTSAAKSISSPTASTSKSKSANTLPSTRILSEMLPMPVPSSFATSFGSLVQRAIHFVTKANASRSVITGHLQNVVQGSSNFKNLDFSDLTTFELFRVVVLYPEVEMLGTLPVDTVYEIARPCWDEPETKYKLAGSIVALKAGAGTTFTRVRKCTLKEVEDVWMRVEFSPYSLLDEVVARRAVASTYEDRNVYCANFLGMVVSKKAANSARQTNIVLMREKFSEKTAEVAFFAIYQNLYDMVKIGDVIGIRNGRPSVFKNFLSKVDTPYISVNYTTSIQRFNLNSPLYQLFY